MTGDPISLSNKDFVKEWLIDFLLNSEYKEVVPDLFKSELRQRRLNHILNK